MNKLIEYAKKFIGVPYIWGGEHPAHGFDCSGYLQHVLQSVGMDPPGDQTAQVLYDHFLKQGEVIWEPRVGALMFYGKDTKSIIHISLCINENQIIEAGGAGSNATDLSKSIAAQAYVRVRPSDHRRDHVATIMPKYPEWMKNG